MKKLFTALFTMFIPALLLCQQIQVYSIRAIRQGGGDNGYTLDGSWMLDARGKLLNTHNFGSNPNSIYPKAVTVTDAYELSNSLTEVTSLSTNDIFFFGAFDILTTSEAFTQPEIDSLHLWSLRGGKMIICAGQASEDGQYDSRVLNDAWGFEFTLSLTSCIPTAQGNSTDLFTGPFGHVTAVNQGSQLQGYFSKYPQNSQVFAVSGGEGGGSNPTVYMDCNTLDLIVADVDIYTTKGTMSTGSNINNNQDKFWANTIAFMDKLQAPPVLIKEADTLVVNNNYIGYQWYHNGEPIQGATNNYYYFSDFGTYYVETKVNGGCIVRSNDYTRVDTLAITDNECDLFVPTAFSPDHNGINETLCMYGNCFKDIDFKIFDRWGELIFTSNSRYECWDGTYKGAKANSGVYVWNLKATRPSGTKINQKGNITLIR